MIEYDQDENDYRENKTIWKDEERSLEEYPRLIYKKVLGCREGTSPVAGRRAPLRLPFCFFDPTKLVIAALDNLIRSIVKSMFINLLSIAWTSTTSKEIR